METFVWKSRKHGHLYGTWLEQNDDMASIEDVRQHYEIWFGVLITKESKFIHDKDKMDYVQIQ